MPKLVFAPSDMHEPVGFPVSSVYIILRYFHPRMRTILFAPTGCLHRSVCVRTRVYTNLRCAQVHGFMNLVYAPSYVCPEVCVDRECKLSLPQSGAPVKTITCLDCFGFFCLCRVYMQSITTYLLLYAILNL